MRSKQPVRANFNNIFSIFRQYSTLFFGITNICIARIGYVWSAIVVLLILLPLTIFLGITLLIIGILLAHFLNFHLSCFTASLLFLLPVIIIIITVLYPLRFLMSSNGDSSKTLVIIPSSPLTMFLVSRIAGVTDLTKQEIRAISKGHRVYEVHLKKKYAKQGKITPEEILKTAEQLYAAFDNAVFYTISPINLPDKLKGKSYLIPACHETKIPQKAALRLRDRPMPYYFYFRTSGPTVE